MLQTVNAASAMEFCEIKELANMTPSQPPLALHSDCGAVVSRHPRHQPPPKPHLPPLPEQHPRPPQSPSAPAGHSDTSISNHFPHLAMATSELRVP